MDIEKIKHSKCPNCKKYGIGSSRGLGYRSTYVETCKYCGKRFRVNSALAFLLKAFIPLSWAGIIVIINTYIIKVPVWIAIAVGLILFYLIIRICPMEEEKDK